MGYQSYGEYSRYGKMMPSDLTTLVTGGAHMGKISSPVTEISAATELTALSYEQMEIFTKDLAVWQDLENRASLVKQAHKIMKRPLKQHLSKIVI